jgi:tetratricopeptide (TPR) repeat protein
MKPSIRSLIRPSGRSTMSRFGTLVFVMLMGIGVVSVTAACTAAGSDEGAIDRGDAAFAQGDYSEALAEYRLALRQGSEEVPTLIRAAHAYARVGRIDEARTHYEAAIRQDPSIADIASADLLRVARNAVERRDGIAAAAAVEAAIALQPGVSLGGLALPLARHFSRNAQYGEALPFYQKAVAEENGSTAEIMMEMALAHQELGDCERALAFFEQVRPEVAPARRTEVDWHVGNCSFLLAREAQDRGDQDDALRYYRTTIDIGEPRNRLAQAWFQSAEILADRGQAAAAIQAFEQVIRDDLGEGLFLQQRARERIDQIRFPGGGAGRF